MKTNRILALLALLLSLPFAAAAQEALEIYCIDPCGGCMGAVTPCTDNCTVEDELYLRYRSLLDAAQDGREIRLYNVRREPERYGELAERLGDQAAEGFELPVVLTGEAAFPADGSADEALLGYLCSGGARYPGYAALRQARDERLSQRKRSVLYFYSAYCEDCKKVSKWIGRALPADVQVVRLDVGTQEGMLAERAVHAAYGIPEDQYYVPLVVYGEDWLMGKDAIQLSLPSRIEEHPDAVTPEVEAMIAQFSENTAQGH